MYKQKGSTFYNDLKPPFKAKGGVSPMKSIGAGIGDIIGSFGAKKRAAKELKGAQAEEAGAREAYMNMDFSNPYANMENTAEDLTVNQQAADLAKQQFQQSQANILGSMQQTGGSFNAGNIQALVGAGQQAAAATAADIGKQEQANQAAAAQQAARNQAMAAQGEAAAQEAKRGQTETLFGMSQQRLGAAEAADAEAKAMLGRGIGGVIGGSIDLGTKALMAGSDIRLKENIKHIGYSKSGIPTYEFKYKGCETIWSGTMAQDLINLGIQDAVELMDNGYYAVDYNMIDVDMLPCK
jgi:hypothetical protein|tara:strand:- start:11253 stop:12140 length:888 start_codon:yes stop_codon:yes gene_type:complete